MTTNTIEVALIPRLSRTYYNYDYICYECRWLRSILDKLSANRPLIAHAPKNAH